MKLEKDLLKQLTRRLSLYTMTGEISWFGRLNSLKVKTIMGTWIQGCPKGTPDILAFVNTNDGMTALFIECKSKSGTLRPEQLAFMKKYQSHPHINVMLLKDIEDFDKWISLYAIDTTKELPNEL